MSQKEKQISAFALMSGTGRRLNRWKKAGLISDDQIRTILNFEKENQGKRWVRNLVGIALFAILIGILSIIAANWAHIPGSVKIGTHFLMNMAATFTIWHSDKTGNKNWREGATLVFTGLNLTLIVLIGQVFQLSGNYAAALTLWMGISSPAIFMFGKTPMTIIPWAIATLGTTGAIVAESVNYLTDFHVFLTALIFSLCTPLIFMAVQGSPKKAKEPNAWGDTLYYFGALLLTAGATIASIYWYVDLRDVIEDILKDTGSYSLNYLLMLTICTTPLFMLFTYKVLSQGSDKESADNTGITFVAGSLISMILPIILMPSDINTMAAIHFVAYWCFLGWLGYRSGHDQIVTLATALITLRIIAVYFELFGGLLTTGFGLIGSGILLLASIHVARKIRNRITSNTTNGGSNE